MSIGMSSLKASSRRAPGVALLILDMLSEYKFPGAAKVLRHLPAAARAIHRLKMRAIAHGIPVIYVNDTANKWESNQEEFVGRCCAPEAKGREVSMLLAPSGNDYFMFKPKHSGFYGTPLQTLLQRLRIKKLILTGMTSHQCVLFTAVDAYVRDFELIVPRDCIGGSTAAENTHALFLLNSALKARTTGSKSIRFGRL